MTKYREIVLKRQALIIHMFVSDGETRQSDSTERFICCLHALNKTTLNKFRREFHRFMLATGRDSEV